jgi:hypothetical protein
MARDYLSLSSRLGYLEHGPERANALAAMRRHSDLIWAAPARLASRSAPRQWFNELELRQPSGDDGPAH